MNKLREGKTALQGIGVVLVVEGSRMVSSGDLEMGAILVALGLITIHSYHFIDEKRVREIISEMDGVRDTIGEVSSVTEEEED